MPEYESPLPRLDLDEFMRDGYLQEANRRFFHPLGLALFVDHDANNALQIGGIIDYRSDPEGVAFAPEQLDATKYATIQERWNQHAAARETALGWVVQPVEV